MKRYFLICAALFVASSALSPSTAHAREPDGFAVGGGFQLGGPTGLVFQYHTGPVIVDIIAGINFFTPDEGDDQLTLGLAGGVMFDLVRGRDTHLQGATWDFSSIRWSTTPSSPSTSPCASNTGSATAFHFNRRWASS